MKVLTIAATLALISAELVAAKSKVDPCTVLAKHDNSTSYPPSMVEACYRNFPYDKSLANEILDTVSNIHSNFYTFLDMAKTKPAKGFTYNPVDVLGSLEKIRKKHYKTDFDFNNDITQLIHDLHDAHANYWSLCYTTFSFSQPIYLYAPVVNNKQSLRVFHVDPTYTANNAQKLLDCEVLEIDGKPGFEHVVEYANSQDDGSKDLGVRLNDVLAGYTLYGTNQFMFWPGFFSLRSFVPDKDTMTYKFQCPKSKKPITMTVPWKGFQADGANFNFTDSKSYWKANCAALPPSSEAGLHHAPGKHFFPKKAAGSTRSPSKEGMVTEKFPFTDNISNGLLFVGNNSRFYKLSDELGVAMISTEMVTFFTRHDYDYVDTITGFQKLADAGVKKVLIDLVNNGGGYSDYGTYISALLFPNTTATFPHDLRASKVGQALAKSAISTTDPNLIGCSAWDSRQYVEWNPDPNNQTTIEYDMYAHPVVHERAGDKELFSSKGAFGYYWPFFPSKPFPWGSKDFAIFTNGACGSGCTLFAAHMKYYNNVKTAAIGGFHKTPLTAISFPGGFVYGVEEFFSDWSGCGIANYTSIPGIPKPMPIQSVFRVPVSEIYHDLNASIPLEYIPLEADLHLDYTPENARNPVIAWKQVAKALLGV